MKIRNCYPRVQVHGITATRNCCLVPQVQHAVNVISYSVIYTRNTMRRFYIYFFMQYFNTWTGNKVNEKIYIPGKGEQCQTPNYIGLIISKNKEKRYSHACNGEHCSNTSSHPYRANVRGCTIHFIPSSSNIFKTWSLRNTCGTEEITQIAPWNWWWCSGMNWKPHTCQIWNNNWNYRPTTFCSENSSSATVDPT